MKNLKFYAKLFADFIAALTSVTKFNLIGPLFFTANQKWRRVFYRILDGSESILETEDADRLSRIEMEIFGNIVLEVEKKTEMGWSGSRKENRLADEKVAMSIRNSLHNYERDRKADAPSFFKFK